MSVARRLLDTFKQSRGPTYECGLCGLTFDREPQNCPACGSDVYQHGKA